MDAIEIVYGCHVDSIVADLCLALGPIQNDPAKQGDSSTQLKGSFQSLFDPKSPGKLILSLQL